MARRSYSVLVLKLRAKVTKAFVACFILQLKGFLLSILHGENLNLNVYSESCVDSAIPRYGMYICSAVVFGGL